MKIQVVGCSCHSTTIDLRERLAFGPDRLPSALAAWQLTFPGVEIVVLSTCNRVELYSAAEDAPLPTLEQITGFLARFHNLDLGALAGQLYAHEGERAVRHLFAVAASLDSMVVGESQILNQVRQAYQQATEQLAAGPMLHAAFQGALVAARRVASETAIHERRVSVPSIAVADFARQIFERFDDKHIVVIGAGEMAEETLRYLREEGAHQITVINRSLDRADELAEQWRGRAARWDQLVEALATADLVISTTAAGEPIVSVELFARVERARQGQALFILDLAVPRDFDSAIGQRPDVYLYSIDDLKSACERNRRQRDRELPGALRVVDREASQFMADWRHRMAHPIIEQLRQGWERPKEDELRRLLNKLPELDGRQREEIRRAFDRLVNKLLHPPLESLRDESRRGAPHLLMDALATLFRLKD